MVKADSHRKAYRRKVADLYILLYRTGNLHRFDELVILL